MSEEKTVGHWVRIKIQRLEGFQEWWQESQPNQTMLTDQQWWDRFIEWLES